MLYKSTNVTAEIIGLFSASIWGRRVNGLKESASLMNGWFNNVYGENNSILANHSGLTTETRVSALDFTSFLSMPENMIQLPGILRKVKFNNKDTKLLRKSNVEVFAKTGTMYYNRGLAGYICRNGEPVATFSIFVADINKKNDAVRRKVFHPPDSKVWLRKARRQEKLLLAHWSKLYA